MSFYKNGIITSSGYNYLVNNFTETKTTTNWTLGGSLTSYGIAVLTGTSPTINSSSFTVNADDIIVVEWNISVPTPSTPSGSGKGPYLGLTYGTNFTRYTQTSANGVWSNSGASTNQYFLFAYNLTEVLYQKHLVLGSNVDIANVPLLGETSNWGYAPQALKLPSGTTSCYIRSGYNSNSSMVIDFWSPKIYKLDQHSFVETGTTTKIGNGYYNATNFIEY